MRDFGILAALIVFLGAGTVSPFILTLGYVWTDTFYPQWLSLWLFPGASLSALMGAAAIGGYLLLDRRNPPRLTLTLMLTLLLAAWITVTGTWAAAPDLAWIKWDRAIKTILFSAFVPFVIRSRVQIEALVQIFVFSAAGHLLPWGLKTIVDGGGYNRPLGLLGVNAGAFGESSMVAAAIIMLIPLLLSLRRHSLLIPFGSLRTALYYGYIAIGTFGVIGTFARTAIVCAGVMLSGLLVQSRHKLIFLAVVLPLAGGLSLVVSSQWRERIGTIDNPASDTSADTRLIIWRWTLDYANAHPFGGGFSVHDTSVIEVPMPGQDQPVVERGRAPHSIYFEVLGEHGWIGLGLLLGIVAASLWTLRKAVRRTRGRPELSWCCDLAKALQVSIVTMLAGGAFIGISYQPTLWYLFSLSVCLGEYARRATAEHPQRMPAAFPAAGRHPASLARPAIGTSS